MSLCEASAADKLYKVCTRHLDTATPININPKLGARLLRVQALQDIPPERDQSDGASQLLKQTANKKNKLRSTAGFARDAPLRPLRELPMLVTTLGVLQNKDR
eukprot:6488630-Amphidinium_carterae.1